MRLKCKTQYIQAETHKTLVLCAYTPDSNSLEYLCSNTFQVQQIPFFLTPFFPAAKKKKKSWDDPKLTKVKKFLIQKIHLFFRTEVNLNHP